MSALYFNIPAKHQHALLGQALSELNQHGSVLEKDWLTFVVQHLFGSAELTRMAFKAGRANSICG